MPMFIPTFTDRRTRPRKALTACWEIVVHGCGVAPQARSQHRPRWGGGAECSMRGGALTRPRRGGNVKGAGLTRSRLSKRRTPAFRTKLDRWCPTAALCTRRPSNPDTQQIQSIACGSKFRAGRQIGFSAWMLGDTHHVSRHYEAGVLPQHFPDAKVAGGVQPVLHRTARQRHAASEQSWLPLMKLQCL